MVCVTVRDALVRVEHARVAVRVAVVVRPAQHAGRESRLRTPELKVSTPAHIKHPGWRVGLGCWRGAVGTQKKVQRVCWHGGPYRRHTGRAEEAAAEAVEDEAAEGGRRRRRRMTTDESGVRERRVRVYLAAVRAGRGMRCACRVEPEHAEGLRLACRRLAAQVDLTCGRGPWFGSLVSPDSHDSHDSHDYPPPSDSRRPLESTLRQKRREDVPSAERRGGGEDRRGEE